MITLLKILNLEGCLLMPKEYIEREALKEDIKNHFKKLIDEGYVYDEIFDSNAEISRIIEAQPTADVVEVVRCGECRYFHEYNVLGTKNPSGWGKCKKISMDIDITINDFCSYGVRKEV